MEKGSRALLVKDELLVDTSFTPYPSEKGMASVRTVTIIVTQQNVLL